MTIGIDIRILGSKNRTGIVEYSEQIIRRMIKAAPQHRFKLFYSSFRRPLPDYDWLKADNVELHSFRLPNNLLFLVNRLFERPRLDLMLGGADVFFSPHFFMAALSPSCRRAMVFHDLSYLRFPEFFTLKKKLWHAAMAPLGQARLADTLIAVSESTKSDLVKLYGLDPARIQVIYSGVDMTKPDSKQLQEFKKRKGLPDRYIFSLGTLEPRKNILGLIRAFSLLLEKPEYRDCQLLVAGERGWLDQEVMQKIDAVKISSRIRYLGHISDQERAGYYSLASVFAYPSFFEGFGFPVLEAMACGTPVLTSHNSSLPEVAGPAALLIDPYSISAMSEALATLLSDKDLRRRCVALGQEQVRLFDWDKCARHTLAALEA